MYVRACVCMPCVSACVHVYAVCVSVCVHAMCASACVHVYGMCVSMLYM